MVFVYIKYKVPKHDKGIVKLKVFYENDRIDEPYDKPSLFEFKSIESDRKRKKKIAIFDKDQDFYCIFYI